MPVEAADVNGCNIGLAVAVTSPDGKNLSYDMTATNTGLQVCNSSSITIYYSNGEVPQSTTPKANSANYYWKLGNLGTNQSVKVNAKTILNSTDGLHTEACATANNGTDSCVPMSDLDINANQIPAPTPEPEPVPVPTPNPNTETTPVVTNPANFYPKGEYGMWVWTSPVQMTDAYRTQLINTASVNNINVLYVTIDDYLAIYNLAPSATRTSKLQAYDAAVVKLIDAAKLKGIAVDAEAGWKDWADPAKRSNSYNVIDYVASFNATHDNDFRKMQFDVEPYLLSTYERNKASVLTNYMNYIGDVVTKAKSVHVDLAFVIPHFYDSIQKWTPQITYNGKLDYTFNHILSILDTTDNASIIIMAYRNFATGNDSIVQISQQEVKDASNGVHPTDVVVAVETGDVDPSYVTFFGLTKKYMSEQMLKVNNQFATSAGYNGMAVHYYEPFAKIVK